MSLNEYIFVNGLKHSGYSWNFTFKTIMSNKIPRNNNGKIRKYGFEGNNSFQTRIN